MNKERKEDETLSRELSVMLGRKAKEEREESDESEVKETGHEESP